MNEADTLFFDIGSFGPGYLVELRPTGLWYCACCPDRLIEKEQRIETTPRQWENFWAAVERAGVWDWRRNYETAEVCDGSWWTLKLRHGSRQLSSKGLNAYPGGDGSVYSPHCSFGRFLMALRLLAGKKRLG